MRRWSAWARMLNVCIWEELGRREIRMRVVSSLDHSAVWNVCIKAWEVRALAVSATSVIFLLVVVSGCSIHGSLKRLLKDRRFARARSLVRVPCKLIGAGQAQMPDIVSRNQVIWWCTSYHRNSLFSTCKCRATTRRYYLNSITNFPHRDLRMTQ